MAELKKWLDDSNLNVGFDLKGTSSGLIAKILDAMKNGKVKKRGERGGSNAQNRVSTDLVPISSLNQELSSQVSYFECEYNTFQANDQHLTQTLNSVSMPSKAKQQ